METLQENFIDVTLIEPKSKHPTIFKVFDNLSGGESLIIHNDHDPKPVYYQLLGERGDTFNWQYLQQGPDWWDVRITKKGEDDKETIGQIAVKDLRKAEVFKKYGIDFCCGGKKTIRQVCAEKGIDATKVEQELQQMNQQNKTNNNAYDDWNLDFLADYITNTHHRYIRKYLPELRGYALKVAQVHGERHAELLEIQKLVEGINEELTQHLEQEEKVLFAYVKKIVQAKNTNQPLDKKGKDLETLIEELEKDHAFIGESFDKIRVLCKGYAIPEDACASYKLLFKMLQEFEDDLHLHIHLENNILFPKAIRMEKNLG
ncbi:iron-sulfur cluster repair di-iron protein [Segetibacter koreensis]|uniref:iron-sulfur cluster repair di-iron protein n=1 Tax=Segetibacter koreensis TaxID=398037 RepID=UPI000382CE5B|nr:iron-sulfur cluster repair di-iron protein [Segetibacter koreensis]